jgi:cytidine deaminase
MPKEHYSFEFDAYESINDLAIEDADLLNKAKSIAENAYAPYSDFFVGAAALLNNGSIVTGTNQENASYPVGLCAERSLMATAATLFPKVAIKTMAISYHNKNGTSNRPISPCGMCRQYLSEYEQRLNQPIRLILAGLEGKVYIINTATQLLPLSFTSDFLK